MKSRQLAQKRGPVPVVRLVGDATDIVIDGRLDDAYWRNCPVAATGRLRELQTGRTPTFGTTFQSGWRGSSVFFAIRCEERSGDKPRGTSTRDDDQAIWHGDLVELEIATETHSYYQVAISPTGHVVDLDRGAPKGQWFGWDSRAEVVTRIADDHWTIEICLPVTPDENDPLHQIIGRKPTQSLPWHINICRQRIRDDGQELSALSPTGTAGFHEPLKFAHFYDGRSHRFDFDPGVTDFALGFRAATQPRRAEPFLALAEGKITDFQKAAALEQAARYDRASAPAMIGRIPIDAVQKAAHMRHLLATFQSPEIIARFAEEDLSKWPFWKRGDGYHARGQAYFITKAGEKGEADLTAALQWTSEPRSRDAIYLTLAQNREQNLHNDDAALTAYRAIVEDRQQISGADEFAALLGIARILTRQKRFADALAVLNRANPGKLPGVWRERMLKAVEEVRNAQNEKKRP